MDSDHLRRIQKMLQEKIRKHDQISIYLEDRNSDGISLTAVLKDLVFEMKRQRSFQKIAVVTDARFFKLVTDLKEKLVATEVESFDSEDRLKAMNWVME